jgi:hypothetical protein
MARKLRVEYPGAIYHVMSRGDRREPIFKDDTDRKRFVETLRLKGINRSSRSLGWHFSCVFLRSTMVNRPLNARYNGTTPMWEYLGTAPEKQETAINNATIRAW